MKAIKLLCVLSALLFLCGCRANDRTTERKPTQTGDTTVQPTSSVTAGTVETKPSTPPLEEDSRHIFSDEIIIYKVSRDTAQAFLKQPMLNVLQNNSDKVTTFSQSGGAYTGWHRCSILTSMVQFLGNKTSVEQYLVEQNVSGSVENMAVLDAPWLPMTVWIRTTEQQLYITVDEKSWDDPHVYRLYTETEFLNRYLCKKGTLIVNDQIVETENAPLLYFNNADVPLMPVLEALGATVVWQNNEIASVQLNGVRYRVNIPEHKLCYEKGRQDNLLYLTAGGPVFVYTANRDIMADTASLACALSDMGVPIYCYVNSQSGTVEVQSRGR